MKPAVILPDYTAQTVSSLLVLLQTGTITVNNQTERLRIQELQRQLGCGFSMVVSFFNILNKPRIKEKWITRPMVMNQVM